MLVAGCSTRKNTAGTRFYHALTTRYNIYFNGNEAYKAGLEAQQQGNKDNYMEMLPLYPINNKTSAGIGASDFDRAIEKAQKAIRQHSIKRRPARKPGRAYTDEYKKWLARREFNPFMHRAWMLLGKAQYQKGDFSEAAATFSYIARLYEGQNRITSEALIRLARCYSALGWQYDAEDALNRVNNDSLPLSLGDTYASATAIFLLDSKRYREVIPYLERTAGSEKNKQQKARCYYLLGQTYQLLQQPEQAYQAYGKAIRLNPPYELELSARIRQTEVMSATDIRKTTGRLLRLSRDEKNEEYLDQIYYALGNVYLAGKDTVQALDAYHKGVEKSRRNGAEKGILQLTLGNLYWQQARYAEAQKAYTEAIGLIDKTQREYATATTRSEILDELVPHVNVIHLQDSLRHLAGLTEGERMAAIEGIIAQVIAREEAERKAAEDATREANRQQVLLEANSQQPAGAMVTRPGQSNTAALPQPAMGGKQEWYFYNPQLVEQGKAEFQRLWGRRKLEDNWRRKNKTVVELDDFEEIDYSTPEESAGNDTIQSSPLQDETADAPVVRESEDGEAAADSSAGDRHRPEYYLAQIPLTEKAMEASNALLSEALYNAGIIFRDRMNNLQQAEAIFERLVTEFPEYEQADEVYYQLFLTELAANYYEQERNSDSRLAKAERYKSELIARFPESRYAKTLADPDFAGNAVHGRQREDSLYARAYECFQSGDTAAVRASARVSSEIYPLGKHRPKFMFLDAVTRLQEGESGEFLAILKELVRRYPGNEITDLAAHILKGVQEGRLLSADSHTFGSIWQRRNDLAKAGSLLGDSLNASSGILAADSAFSTERNAPFLFILAYEEGKVNENMLLFEVARYNFSTFLVKNFDLAFVRERGIGMLQIRPFNNYDEAQQYFRRLYAHPEMATRLSGMRAVLISEANYELLIKQYSFDDYDAFYRSHFSSIPEPELKGYTLDEPLLNLPTEEEQLRKEENPPAEEDDPENGVIFEE
ncbi:tetratricopeptide repeat protein [Bacteroides sp. UBA939]|uniref:type IX secretion system periplasmic lipoprotein PorW/SprE n=1 Tax=Bacteroides sp. UBA939 TaxID=1946092 RepID=UPI0025BD9B15|nr:tetratricopeptide repeat protein [Bacteroides sp. UBA939]